MPSLFLRLLSLCLLGSIFAATAADRPKIGLVLSGGGAKGAAHVGVLKVLEAHHIPVDYVAGTSIGAYVGGMYALGYSANEIEALMMKQNWSSGYSDLIPREQLAYREKQTRDQYNIPLNLGIRDGEVQAPSGVLLGQSMSRLYRNTTGLVPEYSSFNDLAIPFRAVATDLETSRPVILNRGSLVQAMQASATVPGALQPAVIDGKILVDGGIANNMPVDVVKAMGADIVIAVDIGSELVKKNQLNGAVAVLNQLSTMLTQASTERQKMLLTDRDILIRPDIDSLSTTDFSDMPKALKAGEVAANKLLPELQHLAMSTTEYQAYVKHKKAISGKWLEDVQRPVTQIVYHNDAKVSHSMLTEVLGIKVGDVVDKQQLDDAINRLYSLDKFERVNAEFEDTDDGRVLTVTTKAKSWGPNYLQFGFNWEDDFSMDSAVTLDFALTLKDLTENGGEWRNEAKLGFEKMLATEFYQPLDANQKFYGRARYQYEEKNWDIFNSNILYYQLDRSSHQVDFGIGYNYLPEGLIELGLTANSGQLSNRALIGDIDFTTYGAYFKLGYDSLDNISFPTSGNRVTVNVFLRNEKYNGALVSGPDRSLQIQADWKGVVSVRSHSFVGKASYASVDKEGDEDFTIYVSDLGGFLNLSGYHKDSLAGAQKLFGAFIYQYDLGRDALGMKDYPLYLGASIEAGNVWGGAEHVTLNDLIYAGSIYLGTNTPLGPAALGIGVSDDGEQAMYLFIGKNF
ncbi:patatin-like phospholipase family protein [Shewanella dokdonensis]|uniref:patatin-like phospholipase family protein n=1 Tax=Shewanella dokdonensis TaxID=712036 RepID=UPI00200BD4EE|nr:patatin-like phospholipase family protein [Shewanella dokdonensis]MCL1076280.1 patatin-like phospholipase family protein [Shewanella dokdonensis]